MSPVPPELLSRLLREHGPPLVLYARQWCHTPEDVVQEAFLRLMEQEQLPENVAAWLYRVVRNGALNAARSAARREKHESAAARRGEPWFESGWDERFDAATATDALQGLPLEQRETIVARLWGGLSLAEIAQISGTSISTVYRRYQAGIEALREKLGALCPDDEDTNRT